MAESQREAAFVLPPEAVPGSSAPVNFVGFPGRWTPGEPVAARDLFYGLGVDTVKAVKERVDELGLPLREVYVEAGSAPLPDDVTHVPNVEEAVREETVEADAEAEAPARRGR